MPKEEAETQRALVQGATDYSKFADVDFVIEATTESIELKGKSSKSSISGATSRQFLPPIPPVYRLRN